MRRDDIDGGSTKSLSSYWRNSIDFWHFSRRMHGSMLARPDKNVSHISFKKKQQLTILADWRTSQNGICRCKSLNYYNNNGTCQMSSETANESPGHQLIEFDDVNYYENLCFDSKLAQKSDGLTLIIVKGTWGIGQIYFVQYTFSSD